MTKVTRKVLSLLLATVLLFGMLPVSAYAAEAEQTGVAAPEVNVTGPPEATESEPVESIGNDTIPTETAQAVTVPMETTVPVTDPEITHGEEVAEHAETVSDETVPEETQPEETVPATEPAVTEPMDTQPEITETAPVETSPALDITTQHPLAALDNILANTGTDAEITPYASDDGRCLVLGRVWTNVYENGSNQITYEYPAGTVKSRPHVELHVVRINDKWKAAYCMEPGVPTVPTTSGYNNKVFTMEQLLESGLLSDNLTLKKVRAMGLAALYGQQKVPGQTDMTAFGRMAATQMLMWEIAIGWRSSDAPYIRTNDAFARRFLDKKNAGTGCLVNGSAFYGSTLQLGYADAVQTAYNEIAAKVEKHFTIPSFADEQPSKAPIIYLLPDGKGNYTATVTDTNGILSEYTLPSMAGVTFTKNGNTLTITTKEKFDATLVTPTKEVPNFEEQTYYYWYSGSYQTLISCAAEPSNDPVPAYFKIQSKEREGTGKIVKTSTNGGTVEGWWFYVWNVTDGSNVWAGRYKTDSQGTITLKLAPGRYRVREVKLSLYESEGLTVPDGVDPNYWVQDTTDKYLDITANGTATVTFNNSYYGKLKIQKSTNTGGNLEGWIFEVRNASGNVVATVTTDSAGVATCNNLEPGIYTIREVNGPNGVWNDTGWLFDVTTSGGVVVGSGNMFDNASFNGTSRWSGSNKTGCEAVTYDGKMCLKIDPSVGTGSIGFGVQTTIKNISAGKYTVSADVYVPTERSIVVSAWTGSSWSGIGSNSFWCKAGWNHIEHTFNFTSAYDSIHVGFGCSQSNGAFYVYHSKLEWGSRATAWTDNRTVTVTAGSTATHNVKNVKGGKIAVQKNTNTGEYLSGWLFEVKDSSGKLIATLETDADGYAVTEILAPGTYTVTEIGKSDANWNPAHWEMDDTVHTVTVSADTYTQVQTVTYQNSLLRGSIEILKATNTGSNLKGWSFDVATDPDFQNQIPGSPFTTDESGRILIEDLDLDSTYYIREQSGGDWWICDTEVKIVTFDEKHTCTVPVKNILHGQIIVRKNAINGSAEGWQFEILDEYMNVVEIITTDATGLAVSGLLPVGKYFVRELTTLSDYYWTYDADSLKEVEVIGQRREEVSFTNTQYTRISLEKITSTGDRIAGWTFRVYEVATGSLIGEYTTDENGCFETGKLAPNTSYVIEEIGGPADIWDSEYWAPESDFITVTVGEAGQTYALEFKNNFYGKVQIVKTIAEGGDPATLAGWEFILTDAEGQQYGPYITDELGIITTGKLLPGVYTVKEIIPEDSLYYCTSENPQTVTVVPFETVSVTFENALKQGRIELHKCDFLGTPLSGAKFLLEWSKDGDIWTPVFRNDANTPAQGGCSSTDLIDGTLVSGDDGIIAFEGLDPRLMYRVTELKAPEGYQLLADYAYVGYLPTNTVEIQRTVVNFKLFTLPSVGSVGTTEIITGGMFLAVFALALCCILYFPVLSGKTAVKKKYYLKGKNTMKTNMNRILSLLVVLCLTITLALPAFAAENAATAIIDTTKTGSITINKYDMTAATADGVFSTNSFVTTGTVDEAAESVLAKYAIQGVIFSYIKVADIVTYSANETGHKTMVLYAFDEGAATTQLLTALGLTAADAYNNVEGEAGKLYFVSDTLIAALAAKLASNSSILKNDLEAFMDDNNATAMPETAANGKSAVTGLELGLYLLVETYVPENVSKTTAPFFTSVPSTTIDGDNWNYDITLYPKNETDAPNLEKTLRESKPDTGKHNGTTDDITDGYAHTGTASDGDVVDYQIISSLPKITSNATALTTYTFADTLSKGIEYNKNDVVIEWYTDAACTDLIASWTEADGKFAVAYGEGENDATTMTITMTDAGLDEINNSTAVYDANSLFRGYSDCTIRITYAATVNSSADVVYGDNGNPNTVTLTWKRTNTSYYDTLTDDCHVFVYALDLTKYFSDGNGDFSNVNFVIYNETDGYWVVAEQDAETGIYYVTDHVSEEADATVFVPTSDGKIAVKGIEDDTYIITETATDDGYILLKEAITVVITAAGDGEICAVCGKEGVTATATVDGDAVTMTEDNGSLSAVVNFSVVNERGYDMPETGDEGTVMLIVTGILVAVSAVCFCIVVLNKKRFV